MRLITLGNLQVEECAFKRPKPLLLLSYLAIEGVKERRYLSQLFWPNTSNPAHSLSKAVYRLKQGLCIEHSDVDHLIQSDDQSLSTVIQSDALELLDAIEKHDLQRAVELYRGEFLASVNTLDLGEELEQWLLETRDYIAKRVQRVLVSLAQQQYEREQLGQRFQEDDVQSSLYYAEKAYKCLDSALSSQDVIEDLYWQLKLNQSPLAETLLAEVSAFGITLELLEQSRPSQIKSRPSQITSQIASTERKIEIAEQKESAKETKSDTTSYAIEYDSNLEDLEVAAKPRKTYELHSLFSANTLTKFIGREKEVAQVQKLFREDHVRFLSLIGIGGSGKSRLALHIAEQLPEEIADIDERYVVNLQAVKDMPTAFSLIAETLGLEPDLGNDALRQITDVIDSSKTLLVLDNFEYLINEANDLPELLYRCPNLLLIVTSREKLNLPDEWILQIGGLNYRLESDLDIEQDLSGLDIFVKEQSKILEFTQDMTQDLKKWQNVDAVSFFIERAKQADITFNAEANLNAIIELCELVAGLPLALELAATWVRHMSCEQIVKEVTQSLDLLQRQTSQHSEHAERNESIRAVFEHAWQLLSPQNQLIFARLSVFKQGFRREAAAEVAEASILRLATFLDKSLLNLTVSGRYFFHPLLEQFITAKASQFAIDERQLKLAHANFYCDYLQLLKEQRYQKNNSVQLFREDFENICAAWYSLVDFAEFERLEEIQGPLLSFFSQLHRHSDGLELSEYGVKNLFQVYGQAAEENRALLNLRLMQAWAHSSGDYAQSKIFAEEARQLANMHQDDLARAKAIALLGEIASDHEGDKQTAKALFDQALALSERLGELELTARCWRYLASIAMSHGDNEAALDFQRTALKVFENLGDKVGIADSRCEIGHLLVLAKRQDEAESYLLDSLELSKELDFKMGIVNSLCFLGDVAFDRKQYDKCEEYYMASLQLSEEINDYYGIAGGYMDLATSAFQQQEIDKARLYFYEALEKATHLSLKPLQLSILTNVAIMEIETKQSVSKQFCPISLALLSFIDIQEETDNFDKELIQEQVQKIGAESLAQLDNADFAAMTLNDWSQKTLDVLRAGVEAGEVSRLEPTI